MYLLLLKFIYFEKATKFCEIFTLLLTGTTYEKSKVEVSQNFVAFSEYMKFNKVDSLIYTQVKDGKPHGQGVMKQGRFMNSIASVYIGEWANGLKSGYGNFSKNFNIF